MLTFPTYDSYRKAWTDAVHKTPDVPLNIDIELASVCNAKCPFCFWGEQNFNKQISKKSLVDDKPQKRLMPTEMAIKIIDECAELGVPALKFNWRGESTIHPDYSKIICYASGKRIYFETYEKGIVFPKVSDVHKPFYDLLVNTNANCKDAAIDGLMASTKCMISLDSIFPETYAKMRVGLSLSWAFEVIHELVERKHPNLWIRRVITKDNKDEPFTQRVRELFGPTVKISEHQCFDRNRNEVHEIDDTQKYERTYCGYPSQRLMIASDGLCYPCCVDYDTTMPVGDYSKQSIEEIWNGPSMQTLRNQLTMNYFQSDTCKNCTSWLAYKSKSRDNVQDVEIKI